MIFGVVFWFRESRFQALNWHPEQIRNVLCWKESLVPPFCHTFSNILRFFVPILASIYLTVVFCWPKLFGKSICLSECEGRCGWSINLFEVMASMMIMRLLYMSLRKQHRYVYIYYMYICVYGARCLLDSMMLHKCIYVYIYIFVDIDIHVYLYARIFIRASYFDLYMFIVLDPIHVLWSLSLPKFVEVPTALRMEKPLHPQSRGQKRAAFHGKTTLGSF